MSEKLQKVLARAGVGSRRQMEEWIAAGRVTVNGQVAGLGDRVADSDRIEVDGRAIRQAALQAPTPRVIMYYKQVGEVTSRSDPDGRPVVFDSLPKLTGGRWITVGRLDVNTSGLLLCTNDGELAARLMHPSYELPREYAVRVLGEVTPEIVAGLKQGVELEDGPARFETVDQLSEGAANDWFRVSLREGRKREVRRLWESQGLKVSRLIRVRFGPIELPRNLSRGQSRDLTAGELAGLYRAVGLELPKPKPAAAPAPRRSSRRPPSKRRTS